MTYLQMLFQDTPKVTGDGIVAFDKHNVVCSRVLPGNIPEIVYGKWLERCLHVPVFVIKHKMNVDIPPKSGCVQPGVHEGWKLAFLIRDGYRCRNRSVPALCKVGKPLKSLCCEYRED